ncbi:AAA-domain-containing protein [Ascobolus immersus RN42]|uniref:AAA-domain-containing protein n=1 Tax=Ascobolus immersus RN42 TaxID=1160509 RepID=A0A3N4IJ56_ASCIM|nr:AAA-domain-containing protein [Ascobolus immersus RN42]
MSFAARQALNRLQLSSRLVQAKRIQPLTSILQYRQIQQTSILLSTPNAQSSESQEHSTQIFPTVPVNSTTQAVSNSNPDEPIPTFQELAGVPEAGSENVDELGGEARQTKGRGRPVGSKGRTRLVPKPKELPKPEIPTWFYDNGVFLREQALWSDPSSELVIIDDGVKEESGAAKQSETVEQPASTEASEPEGTGLLTKESEVKIPTATKVETTKVVEQVEVKEETKTTEDSELPANKYRLSKAVWNEIIAHVRVGLLLPKASSGDNFASVKSHSILHCPKEGGVYFLDSISEKVARAIDADLVRIDAQDLEEIVGDYLGATRSIGSSSISASAVRNLAYDTQTVMRNREEEEQQEEEDDAEEYDDENPNSMAMSAPPKFQLTGKLQELLQNSGIAAAAVIAPVGFAGFPPPPTMSTKLPSDASSERKIAAVMTAFIEAAMTKRDPTFQSPPTLAADGTFTVVEEAFRDEATPKPDNDATKVAVGPTIIQIRDYLELERTDLGAVILRIFHEIVLRKRKEGIPILVIGTTSSSEESDKLTKSGIRGLQTDPEDSLERSIVVPPPFVGEDNAVFLEDSVRRTIEVNIRHLREVVRRRGKEASIPLTLQIDDETAAAQIPGIDETVWAFDRVHRLALVAIGEHANTGSLDGCITLDVVKKACDILEQSDNAKFKWGEEERKIRKETGIDDFEDPEAESPGALKLKKISKSCNTHEKKLLGGVINPEALHVNFASVQAPPETIEALKTLTSLSLIRPDAFSYGVLSTDRIPGVLLYGPPGTGKTLLAKAVAKESGATVLEVSGSEIFDMYVGEGEKNVKAIFSLAQKLSPCVVFIDEADALFGSRHGHSSRTAHREIINQFLKEWADFKSSAFIMVATNRPSDLDDAVLRRLPRRILLDLPTVKDREEILRIHLASEQLDPSVDIPGIAKQTPLFSGSDLKNVCVTAALNCVREENAAHKATGAPYPAKRTLTKAHFDKALEVISASVAEDMGTLTEIRKFDEKFGERNGRKGKKGKVWGFGDMHLGENAVVEEARVRKDSA